MAFVTGAEIVSRLPDETTVTSGMADGFIASAKFRLAESHAPDALPENDETKSLIEEMAFGRALERHYVMADGFTDEVTAAKEIIDRAEKAYQDYDARHTTTEEVAADASLAFVAEAPF